MASPDYSISNTPWLTAAGNMGNQYAGNIAQGLQLGLERRRQKMLETEAGDRQTDLIQQRQLEQEQREQQAQAAAQKMADQQQYQQELSSITDPPGTPGYQQKAAIASLKYIGQIGQAGPAMSEGLRALTPPKPVVPPVSPKWVPPDPATGMPGHFETGKGISYPPTPRPIPKAVASPVKPAWVPPDPATGMPGHFEEGGKVQFPPQARAVPSQDWRKDPGYVQMVKRYDALIKANDKEPSDELERKAIGLREQIKAFEAAHSGGAAQPGSPPPAPAPRATSLPPGWSIRPAGSTSATVAAPADLPPDDRDGGPPESTPAPAPAPAEQAKPPSKPMTKADFDSEMKKLSAGKRQRVLDAFTEALAKQIGIKPQAIGGSVLQRSPGEILRAQLKKHPDARIEGISDDQKSALYRLALDAAGEDQEGLFETAGKAVKSVLSSVAP